MVKVKYDDGIYAFESENFDLKEPQEMFNELCRSTNWSEISSEPLLGSLKKILNIDDAFCSKK